MNYRHPATLATASLLTVSFLASIGSLCHAQESTIVDLPTLELYFQCGDAYDSSQDLGGIPWDEVLQGYFGSILIQADVVNVTDHVSAEGRPCVEQDERQFRIKVDGATAEYDPRVVSSSSANDDNDVPTPDEISNMVVNQIEDLKSNLSMACYGDSLDAYQYRITLTNGTVVAQQPADNSTDGLGRDSWSSNLCLTERVNNGVNDRADGEKAPLSVLTTVAIVIGGLFLLSAVLCCCVCCGCLSFLCNSE